MPELDKDEIAQFQELVNQTEMINPASIGVSCVNAINGNTGQDEMIYMVSFMVEALPGMLSVFNFALSLEIFEEFKKGVLGAEAHMLAKIGKMSH